jgi:hypothetical protein
MYDLRRGARILLAEPAFELLPVPLEKLFELALVLDRFALFFRLPVIVAAPFQHGNAEVIVEKDSWCSVTLIASVRRLRQMNTILLTYILLLAFAYSEF